MAKYKDSFQTNSESLATGGRGIFTAVENEDTHTQIKKAPPPEFDRPEDFGNVPNIRTLADDLQSTVSKSGVTLSSQINSASVPKKERVSKPKEDWSTEAAPKPPAKKEEPETAIWEKHKKKASTRTHLVIIALSILIFGGSLYIFSARQGIALGSFSFSLPKLPKISFSGIFDRESSGSVREIVAPETLVDVENYQEFLLGSPNDRTQFEQKLNELGQSESNRSTTAILLKYPTVNEESGEEVGTYENFSAMQLFTMLDTSVSSAFLRSLGEYTFGTIPSGKDNELFFVAKIHSYDNSFSALLDWESDMPADLFSIFHNNSRGIFSSNTFKDVTVSGKDARELTIEVTDQLDGAAGDQNEPILIYSFPDKETLIITHSRDALEDILEIFSTEK